LALILPFAISACDSAEVGSTALAQETAIQSDKNCWQSAGEYYSLDPFLLYTIAYHESSLNPRAINTNTNKTRDIGLMQINTFWLPKLAEFGIHEKHLTNSKHIGIIKRSMIS
jgi:soluble lytic murein transglycosylase-like protein